VQGESRVDRELLDVAALVGASGPGRELVCVLGRASPPVFPDGLFADLLGSRTGRPSIPADVIASVLVLQTPHYLSDREAVEALRRDLRGRPRVGWR
jgi:hypothetical protein